MSDNLDLPQVAGNQNQKEVTINDVTAQLSGALADFLAIDLSAGDDTVSDSDFQQYMSFESTGNSITRTLTFPAIKRALFMVQNDGTGGLNVVVGSTSLTLPAGKFSFYQTDGTSNGLKALAASALPTFGVEVDVAISVPGLPATTLAVAVPFNQSVSLASGLSGSSFYIDPSALPTADTTWTLYKNGSSIGTVKFAATTGAVTVTFSSTTSFTGGTDTFVLKAPGSQDATAANMSFNFKFTKL